MATPIDTDALVIGAGPVGLFQAFQLGLQGIASHMVDALPHAGGRSSPPFTWAKPSKPCGPPKMGAGV